MKIVFLAMGCESLAVEQLSAVLKPCGHDVEAFFDPMLFADELYFSSKFLARKFSVTDKVIKKAVDAKPDLIGFCCFVNNLHWIRKVSLAIKKELPSVKIMLGGVYPTSCPDEVMEEEWVDMVCLGDGEEAILEYANNPDRTDIKNLWFRKGKEIIKNVPRQLRHNLDDLPIYDKDIWNTTTGCEFQYNTVYMTVNARGCPFSCTYCTESFWTEFNKPLGAKLRYQSVERVMKELRLAKEKYHPEEIDFKNNSFSADKKWTLEFLKKYKEEINIPYRIMTHPTLVDEDIAKAFKESGCHRIQLGVQSMNEKTRDKILNRHESNKQIVKCFELLDKYKLNYSVDHIFGLPGETEKEQIEAFHYYKKLKSCSRITIFWLEYLPKTRMVEIAKERGMLTQQDIDNINHAKEPNYLDGGSLRDPSLKKVFKTYQILFRALPIIPVPIANFLFKTRLYKLAKILPTTLTLLIIDVLVSFIRNDYSAFQYLKYYIYQVRKCRKE